MDSPQLDPSVAPGTSRRAFLTRSAAGAAAGGLLWVAPAVLTVDAAAAASCGAGGTIDWATVTPATDPGSASAAGVTMTIAHTDPQGRAYTDSWKALTGTFGNEPAWYEMQMNGANTNNFQTATFTFSKAVNGLSFKFLDIDQSSGQWRDRVSVAATGPGGAVTWHNSAIGSNLPTTGATGNPYVATSGTNAGNTSVAGNVTLTFDAAVTTVVVTYTANNPGGGSAPWAEQRIGISNITWTSCS